MGTQLSLLDLIADGSELAPQVDAPQAGASPVTASPVTAPPATGGDPRVAAARASLGQAVERRRRPEAGTAWSAVGLGAGTCELGRRRVARAREVIAAARQRAEAEAQAEAAARQRAALAGAISAGRPTGLDEALSLPARRIRRSRSAA